MRIRIIDAFTDRPFAGNPAAVCLLDGDSWPDEGWMRQVAAETGFRIKRIRYYTPLVGGFVENILMRMAERRMAKRAQTADHGPTRMSAEAALKAAPAPGQGRLAQSGATRVLLRALTAAMKLDLLLFGHVESGPFFALLERVPGQSAAAPLSR